MNSLALFSGTRNDQMYSSNLKYRAKECEGGVELGEKASVESPSLISKTKGI